MSITIRNTRDLADGKNLKLKILLVGFPGFGKTSFLSTVPNILIGACEEGNGNGLASIIKSGKDYCELQNYAEFDQFCSGKVGENYDALALDSLSVMSKTFIKDHALTVPRAKGETVKRKLGVPELDDYGTIGELTRKLLNKLLHLDKHIIVTATMRLDKPDVESGQGELLIGPDLAGQMFLGSTAMFDIVLVGRTRTSLRDPKDAKSKFTERFWTTVPGNGILAKCRYNQDLGKQVLASEELYDVTANKGTFPDLLTKIQAAFTAVPTKAA